MTPVSVLYKLSALSHMWRHVSGHRKIKYHNGASGPVSPHLAGWYYTVLVLRHRVSDFGTVGAERADGDQQAERNHSVPQGTRYCRFELGSGTARHQSLASGSRQLRTCAFWTVSIFLNEEKRLPKEA